MTAVRRWQGALVLVVALLLVGLLQLPFQQSSSDTRWYAGVPGETVATETVAVQVDNPRFATTVKVNGKSYETNHVFVVLDVRMDLIREVVRLQPWLVTTDDYRYASRGIGGEPLVTAQGFASQGVLVFEVPRERIAGATLEFEPIRDVDTYAGRIRINDAFPAPAPPGERSEDLPAQPRTLVRP